jgi:MATE family, multidrug efflux pump
MTFPVPLPKLLLKARALLVMAAPLVGHNLAIIATNTADTMMAGRLSPADLAAVALGSALWMTAMLLGMGILMAVSPLVANAFGGERHRDVTRITRQALWLALGLGLILAVVARSLRPVVVWVGVDPELVPLVDGYLHGLSWGAPGLYLYLVLRFMSEGTGFMRPILLVAVLGALANVPLNYLFMYGAFGLPAMGAVGCGWATTLVNWLMLGAMLIYTRSHRHFAPFELWQELELPDWRRVRTLIRLGLPIGTSLLLEIGLFSGAAMMMAHLGTEILAAHQIAINVASILFMVPLGLAFAITVQVGHALGRGDPAEARLLGFVGIGLTAVLMAIMALGILSFAPAIVSIYTADPAVAGLAISLLYLAAVFQLSDGLQATAAGALRGFQDTGWPMVIGLVAYWLVGAPISWVLGVHLRLGPHMVWVGLLAGLTVAALLLNLRYHRVSSRGRSDPGAPRTTG